MKVKLHPNLDKQGLKFVDPEGQRIGAKVSGKGEVINVKDSEFVREKIRSGELILVEDDKASASGHRKYSDKEAKVILAEVESNLKDARALAENKDLKPETAAAMKAALVEVEAAIKAKDAARAMDAMISLEDHREELEALANK